MPRAERWHRDVPKSTKKTKAMRFLDAGRSPSRLAGAALVLLLAALLVYPILTMIEGAFRTASPLTPGGWTLHAFARLPHTADVSSALTNSCLLTLAVTFLAVSIAALLAFLSERTDSALRRLITPLMIAAVATSPLIYAIGYDLLANPYTGPLNSVLHSLLGHGVTMNIESWPGLILVESLHLSAFAYLFLRAPFRALSRSNEEASLVAGAGRLTTLLRIDVPLLAPIVTGVAAVVLIIGLQILDSGLILGEPAHIHLLGVQIYDLLNNNVPPRYGDASAIGTCLALLVVLMAVVQRRILRRRSYTTVTGKSYRQDRWSLGRWRFLTGAGILLYALLAVVLPLGSILFSSVQSFPGVYGHLGFENYRQLFANASFWPAVRTSLTLAVIGGAVGTLLAFVLAYLSQRGPRALRGTIGAASLLPLALPGLLSAIAVSWAVVAIPGVRDIYGTQWLLLLALIIVVLPPAGQLANSGMAQVALDLEDAARAAGASATRARLGITARLLLGHLVSGWFVGAVLIVGALDAPLILGSASSQTITTVVFTLYTSNQPSEAAAFLSLVILGTLGATGLVVSLRLLLQMATSRRGRTARSNRPAAVLAPEVLSA
jgi:iron(III) transport system permease protein